MRDLFYLFLLVILLGMLMGKHPLKVCYEGECHEIQLQIGE